MSTIVVSDATGIAVGMQAFGTGIATGATVAAIAGTTLTLSAANTDNVSGTVIVRPSQTLVRSWTLSSAGCNADAVTCNALKDVTSPFSLDMSQNQFALHASSCISAPTPSTAFDDVYFGLTTANRAVNILTGSGINLGFRRLTVGNPIAH
jgi:hypothetical protein